MEDLVALKKVAFEYNILVVEDCKHVNQKLIEYLEKFFPEIGTAQNGEEGLEKFNNKRYDIVITDLEMPQSDGKSLVENIMQIDPHVQVIVVSAFGHDENLIALNKMGVVEFIQKPMDHEKLVKALLEAIENIVINNENSNISYTLHEDTYLKLQSLKKDEKTIELINSYKGVNIIQDGFIHDVNLNTITIQTTDTQYKLIKGEKRTIIVIGDKVIRAKLQYVDKKNQQLILRKFETLTRSPKDRKLKRVMPGKDFNVVRYYKGESFTYETISLSSNCVAVRASSLDDSFRDNIHTDLILSFQVTYSKQYHFGHNDKILKPVKLRSKSYIFRIDKLTDNNFKIVFMLDLTEEGKKVLDQYIRQREVDIIQDLQPNT